MKEQGTQTRFLIHYRGFSQIGGIKRFLLDLAQGIEELPRPVSKPLLTEYRDLGNSVIKVKSLPIEVICAEKLALITDRKRKEPRDIYDLWSVFMQVKRFDGKLFLSRYKWRLGYFPNFKIVEKSLRDPDFKSAWEHRLKYQVPNLPNFEVVIVEFVGALKPIWDLKKKPTE